MARMTTSFDAAAAARFITAAHVQRAPYQNLPPEIAPGTLSEAYAAQEALVPLWSPVYGPVAGLKIATTTKVMQALMGIDHPCGGMIYGKRIHVSPARLVPADHIHLMLECELAVQLATALPGSSVPYTAATVRSAVGDAMPAFELIEDRNAVYKETSALSLIADNAWNAGIVVGVPQNVAAAMELNGVAGQLTINGKVTHTGLTDDPMGALAWVANLAVQRGRPLQAGMLVITGSIIATLPIKAGDHLVFELEGFGAVEARCAG
jgi:2-keto-4-pentenoate hydratase